MRRIFYARFAFMLAATAATAATLAAQTPDTSRFEAMRPMHRSRPVTRILAHKADLGLTADQVARLETIQARLEDQNRPLLEQLRAARVEHRGDRAARLRELTPEQRKELRERWQERRDEWRTRMEELRPVMEELRKNNRQALMDARAVLTAEQQARLDEMREQGPVGGGKHPNGRGQHDWRAHRQPR